MKKITQYNNPEGGQMPYRFYNMTLPLFSIRIKGGMPIFLKKVFPNTEI